MAGSSQKDDALKIWQTAHLDKLPHWYTFDSQIKAYWKSPIGQTNCAIIFFFQNLKRLLDKCKPMDITAKTKETLLHQVIKRLERLAPDKFKTDDENLEAIVHSPLESLKDFAVYTYKESRSWFALRGAVVEFLRLDGAIVEMINFPGEGWRVKIYDPVDPKRQTDRVTIFNNDLTIALCEAYEQYLSLRGRAGGQGGGGAGEQRGKSEISSTLEKVDNAPNKD